LELKVKDLFDFYGSLGLFQTLLSLPNEILNMIQGVQIGRGARDTLNSVGVTLGTGALL